MVAETKGVEHAKEMIDVIKKHFDGLTLTGVGGAFGFIDRSDSGQYSDESDEDEDDLEEELDNNLLGVTFKRERRPSKQFAIHEISV